MAVEDPFSDPREFYLELEMFAMMSRQRQNPRDKPLPTGFVWCSPWVIQENNPRVRGQVAFCSLHVSEFKMDAMWQAYRDQLPEEVPERYYLPGQPYKVRVDPASYARIENSDLGMFTAVVPPNNDTVVFLIPDNSLRAKNEVLNDY